MNLVSYNLIMGFLTGRGAFFAAGFGLGTVMAYTTNEMYYQSLRRHIYLPINSELKKRPIDWKKVAGTARKGIKDFAHEFL
jgi:hypothetical protein